MHLFQTKRTLRPCTESIQIYNLFRFCVTLSIHSLVEWIILPNKSFFFESSDRKKSVKPKKAGVCALARAVKRDRRLQVYFISMGWHYFLDYQEITYHVIDKSGLPLWRSTKKINLQMLCAHAREANERRRRQTLATSRRKDGDYSWPVILR